MDLLACIGIHTCCSGVYLPVWRYVIRWKIVPAFFQLMSVYTALSVRLIEYPQVKRDVIWIDDRTDLSGGICSEEPNEKI